MRPKSNVFSALVIGLSCVVLNATLEIELSDANVCINNRNEDGAVAKIALRNRRDDERS